MKQRLGLIIIGLYLTAVVGAVLGCAGATDSSSTSSVSATITSTASGSTSTTPIPMTITFSTDVTGLATTDFTATNATVGSLTATSARVYTFDLTPAGFGTVDVMLSASTVTDTNGTPNTVSNTFSITYAATTGGNFIVTMVDDGNFDYYMNKDGAFGTSCSVSSTASSAEDISCTLDIEEGALWFWGVNLKHEVPASMCKYVRIQNYYFYNFESGYGPSNIQVYSDLDSATGSEFTGFTSLPAGCAANNGTYRSCCVVDGTLYTGCTGIPEVTVDTTTGEASCVYDHTASNAPNCCVGTYNLGTHILVSGSTTVADASTANADWGGNFGNCMAGPAVTDTGWPKDATTGIPFSSVIHYAQAGLSDTWDLGVPSSLSSSGNVLVANSYTTAGNEHAHTADGAGASNYPWAIEPIADRDGSALPSTNGEYVFSCLNAAFDTLHRVTVSIREWNSADKFAAYVGTAPTTLPDVVGTGDPTYPTLGNCYEVASGMACNDRYDWDDFIMNQTTGAFTGYTQDATPANWGAYFPQIQ